MLGLGSRTWAQSTNDEFWPEVRNYFHLNQAVRIYSLTKSSNSEETRPWQGDFGVHFDFAVKPVFRRELGAREDVFEKRFLSFLAGFRYITSLGAGPRYLEHRWLVEMTSRFPTLGKLMLIDCNRGEMRFIGGQAFSTRYSNKLQVERDFRSGDGFRFTPYLYGQLYYDARYDVWNRNRYAAGVRFPAGRHFVPEIFLLRQNDSRASPPHVNAFGITLNLYF